MSQFDLRFEKQLIEDVNSLGFEYDGAKPSLNYDQYHFSIEQDKTIYSVIIEFNGLFFSLAYGIDYRMNLIGDRFSLTYDEVKSELLQFSANNRLVKGVE